MLRYICRVNFLIWQVMGSQYLYHICLCWFGYNTVLTSTANVLTLPLPTLPRGHSVATPDISHRQTTQLESWNA